MHIAEIVSSRGVNGAVMHAWLVARHLRERGHRVTLIARPESWIARQAAAEAGIAVFHSQQNRAWGELRRVRTWLRDQQVDVVHTHNSRAHFFGVLLRPFAPWVTVAAAQNRYVQPHWMFNDLVVAPSSATARFHRRFNLVRRNRLVQINNAIDLPRFDVERPGVRRAIRDEFGFAESTAVLVVVGDVCRRKGLNYLIAALPSLQQSASRPLAVLSVGHQHREFTSHIRSLAARLGVESQLILAGARPDIPEVLQAGDIFVLPSKEDQQPLAILEAMATGLPVVATDVGGIGDCVRDGVTGRLVAANDPSALAEALLPLIEHSELRTAYGCAGRARVRRLYAPETTVGQLESVFERLREQRVVRKPAEAFVPEPVPVMPAGRQS